MANWRTALVGLVFQSVVLLCAPAEAAPQKWQTSEDVSVIWSANNDIYAYRFDELSTSDLSETGCYGRKTEVVTVLSQQLDTPNGADDLFRARRSDGSVESYRIPLHDAPRAVAGWLPKILEEGKRVHVASVTCGMGGFVYVAQITVVGPKK